MKYRAICPSCSHRFSRLYFFLHISEFRHACPSCGARIKSNSRWEWLGGAIFGVPIGILILVAHFKKLSWFSAITMSILILSVAFVLYPYITKYDSVEGKKKVEQTDPVDL